MNTKKKLKICNQGHEFYKSSDCPVCPVCSKQEIPKADFLALLAAPARRVLQNKGISNLEHLSEFSEKEILTWHGIGKSSTPKLQKYLEAKGLKFKTNS
jgi:predicted RecB family nuclease